ncbi:MAG: alkaline phosphatase family protein [Bacteroidetes bacterium]|nr:alkaline phosphatase family protein [Bacteroidota bacterium]
MAERLAKKVLLIGWDAADWKVITPLLDAGQMPALESLINRGVMGNIATLDPPFSPMLWTSIATGHTADRHGIIHFTQPNENGRGIRPILGSTRKVKALWNILSQNGLRSNVVGWWPSHPAEPINGAMVSNFYHKATAPAHAEWNLAPGSIHPPELAETLAPLRVHPAELTGAHLGAFVPRLNEIDQTEDRRITSIAKIIADASSVHAAATWLMENTEWDLTAVYYDAIDHFGHGFMKYHPPRQEHIPEEDFELYKEVIDAGYRFHDMMLARLLELAGEDTTVVLLSDHGFHSDKLRPRGIPKIPAGPAVEHRAFGILCMAGPGIKSDERINGASLLNVTPTILTLFGLPVGKDMAAPPLLQVFVDPPEIQLVDSWESIEGDSGQHVDDAADPWSEQEALRQLIELGYIDEPEGDTAQHAKDSARDSQFNLARVYYSTGRTNEALPLFEQVYAQDSKYEHHYGIWVAHAYRSAGEIDKALALAQQLNDQQSLASISLLIVDLHLDKGEHEQAKRLLDQLDPVEIRSVEMILRKAQIQLQSEAFEDANNTFNSVLERDPDNARAWHGLAKGHIGLKHYGDATDAALSAVAHLYHYPEAHFHLGVAMTRLGWIERAEQAFQVAIFQRPDFPLAHKWLAKLYRRYLGNTERAKLHEERASSPRWEASAHTPCWK